MKSIYASELIRQVVWEDFTAHFKSSTTKGSYQADICEIMDFFEKDFLKIQEKEAEEYFTVLKNRVEMGELKPGTMAKKFRELHSFAEYICDNREKYGVLYYRDVYYPYLKLVAKQEQFVHSVPIEHIDRLLEAAKEDIMAYCIFVLLHRAGLSSTEITELVPEDFRAYDNGTYAFVKGRKEACYIPDDAAITLEKYLNVRAENEYLFYNSRGNRLNTMYISRMLKKYTSRAGLPAYSAENIRNTCGVTLFSYGAEKEQVAKQMGITEKQIKRYKNMRYKENLQQKANKLVRMMVVPPEN